MGVLDTILGSVTGRIDAPGGANPLVGILGGFLTQCGGLQGLAAKFSQQGQGNSFSSWVGMGENQLISSGEIQNVLGSDQVRAIAAKLEWILPKPRSFWPNTCQRSWTNLHRRERSILGWTINRESRPCFHRSCRALPAQLLAVSQLGACDPRVCLRNHARRKTLCHLGPLVVPPLNTCSAGLA